MSLDYPRIRRCASHVGAKWRDTLDPEDIAQEAATLILEGRAKHGPYRACQDAVRRLLKGAFSWTRGSDKAERRVHFSSEPAYASDDAPPVWQAKADRRQPRRQDEATRVDLLDAYRLAKATGEDFDDAEVEPRKCHRSLRTSAAESRLLAVLRQAARPLRSSEIQRLFGRSQGVTAKHLRGLRDRGLIEVERVAHGSWLVSVKEAPGHA